MANKKISELESRASLSLSDLMAVGDPSTGYLYKTTISDLKTLTGAGVVSFNGRFGTVNPAEGDYTLTQLGDVIITSAANNDVLKYNGSNWVNTQLYTGTVAQYIDGTGAYQTFPTLLSSDRLVTNVRNTSGATITKGTVVYLNGSSGTLPTIAKAQANAESTSTGTYGVVQDNIANNANGYVVVIGNLTALDTSAYNAGDILWLSPTVAGGYTTTKPVAPNHAVYVGIVTRSSNTQGTIEVKIQNGYELDELHNVLITSVANNDVLVYETASSLWKNKAFSTLETDTLNSVTGRGNTTANDITVGSVTAAGLSNLLGQIKTFVTTGNTYIGANPTSATDAGFKLDVNGTTRLNGNTTVTGVLTGSDTIRSTNGTVTVSISYGSTAGIIGTTSNHSLEIRTNNTYRVGVSTAGVVNIANLIGTGSRMVVADSAGNLSTQAIPTSAVSSVFGRTGAVVAASGDYTTSQVTEGTNLYYTDARARAAITLTTTGSSGAATYSGGTLNIPTYTLAGLGGQPALSGTGFVKISGTTISYDNSTYLTTSSAASTYLPLAGGTLTGALGGTSATFSGIVTVNNTIIAAQSAAETSAIIATSGWGGGFNNTIITFGRVALGVAGAIGYDDPNTRLYTGTTTNHSFAIRTNNTDKLIIAANGNTSIAGDLSLTPTNSALIFSSGFARIFMGSSEAIRITSGGNFGINTTNPTAKLHVQGTSYFFDEATFADKLGIGAAPSYRLHVVTSAIGGRQNMSNISRTTGNWVRFTNPEYSVDASMGLMLKVFPDSDSRQGAGMIASGGSANGVTNLDLFVSSGSTTSTSYSALTIKGDSGNIAIGNTNTSEINERFNVTGSGIAIEATDGGSTMLFGNFGGANGIIGTYTNDNLVFRTNNTERMRITAGGEILAGSSSAGVGFVNACKIGSYQAYNGDSNSSALSSQRTAGLFTISGGDNSNSQGSYTAIVANVQYGASDNPGSIFRGYGNSTLAIQIRHNGNIEISSGSIKTGSPTDGTAQPWKFGEATNTLYTATRTVKVEINGALYYLLAVASSDL
jgi:hypothetical protein